MHIYLNGWAFGVYILRLWRFKTLSNAFIRAHFFGTILVILILVQELSNK